MNTIDQLMRGADDAAGFARAYTRHVAAVLERLDADAVGALADVLSKARADGRTVFLAGNGGSASTASHWTTDLLHCTAGSGPALRAISLVDNVATLTAIANDRAYEEVFSAQLERLLRPGDVVIVISASGSSPNVVRAVEYANAHGATTVGVLGFDGGRLKDLCRLSVIVPTSIGEYGPVEDVHMILNHVLTSWLRAEGSR